MNNLKNFLKKNIDKNMKIEISVGIVKKVTLKEMRYNIKEDRVNIEDNFNEAEIDINLNEIRNVEILENKAIIVLDDKNDTKIEITKL